MQEFGLFKQQALIQPGLTGRSSGRQHWPCLRHFYGQCWCPAVATLPPAPLTFGVGRLSGSQMPQPVEYSEGCKFRSGEANIAGRSPGLKTTSIVLPVQGQPIQSDQRARHASSLGQAVQLRKATRDLVRVTKALRCFSDASRPVRCSVLALSRSHRGRWQPDANSSRLLWALRRPPASATDSQFQAFPLRLQPQGFGSMQSVSQAVLLPPPKSALSAMPRVANSLASSSVVLPRQIGASSVGPCLG